MYVLCTRLCMKGFSDYMYLLYMYSVLYIVVVVVVVIVVVISTEYSSWGCAFIRSTYIDV